MTSRKVAYSHLRPTKRHMCMTHRLGAGMTHQLCVYVYVCLIVYTCIYEIARLGRLLFSCVTASCESFRDSFHRHFFCWNQVISINFEKKYALLSLLKYSILSHDKFYYILCLKFNYIFCIYFCI